MSTYHEASVFFNTQIGISANPRHYHPSKFRKTMKKYFPEIPLDEYDTVIKKAKAQGNDLYSILSVYDDYLREITSHEFQ